MGGVCGVLTSDGNCEIQTDVGSSPALPTNRPSDEVKINSSVGISAMNMSNDIFAIQYALNKVPPIDGGPSPQIKMDGKCDQQTTKAIQNFQQKHFGFTGATGKIEPNSQTHTKLREISNRYQVFPTLPLDLVADAWFLKAMMQHLPYAKACVQAAMTNLLMAMPYADSVAGNGVFGRDERLKLANRHFMIDGFSSPRPILQKVYEIYGYQLAVLSRPEYYFSLDTDDSGGKISNIAVTPGGGFFSKDLNKKVRFRRGVFLASGVAQFAVHVIIHELRHYVERENEVGHFAKGWVDDPKMKTLLPSQRIYNCDTFANFVLEAKHGIMERPTWIKANLFR